MSKLSWGNTGERYYEAGIDHGVLYIDSSGIAWNGLIAVNESSDGGDARPYYLDGLKYLNLSSAEEYAATIQAVSTPPEFDVCDGNVAISSGLFATNQLRKSFGLCYRTKIGNDIDGVEHGYKLHLVYNALAAPSSHDNVTVSESPKPMEFSWAITTMPPMLASLKPTAHLVIDSRTTDTVLMASIEDILYGSELEASRLPTPDELVMLYNASVVVIS